MTRPVLFFFRGSLYSFGLKPRSNLARRKRTRDRRCCLTEALSPPAPRSLSFCYTHVICESSYKKYLLDALNGSVYVRPLIPRRLCRTLYKKMPRAARLPREEGLDVPVRREGVAGVNRILSTYGIPFLFLSAAAVLEVLGDSFFQSALHRSTGTARMGWIALGVTTLGIYGLLVNVPRWDFGRLLGVYVVFFFFVAQLVAKLRFHQPMTLPLRVGSVLIGVGGLIIVIWK